MNTPASSQRAVKEPEVSEQSEKHAGDSYESIHSKIVPDIDIRSNLGDERGLVRIEIWLDLSNPVARHLDRRDAVPKEAVGRQSIVGADIFGVVLVCPFPDPNIGT